MNIYFSRLAIVLSTTILFGAGCIGGAIPANQIDGGVWKSTDGGNTWMNKKALVQGAKVTAGVGTAKILQVAFDPQDNRTIYLATMDTGLLYSLDAGETWQQPASMPSQPATAQLNSGRVGAIAVDAKNKCVVYAAKGNSIFKTMNCGRDWDRIFFDPRAEIAFTQLNVDWYNSNNVYSGTSLGDVYKSDDTGITWKMVTRSDGNAIVTIAVDPRDSRLIYAATYGGGVLKSPDGGNTWRTIIKEFGDELYDSRRAIQLAVDPIAANVVYIVSKYGIVKTENGGDTWKGMTLTTPPGSIKINSIAIDPKNNKHILYTGIGVLQSTDDGGSTWKPRKLPTTQIGSTLVFDPVDSKILYLGTTALPPKQ